MRRLKAYLWGRIDGKLDRFRRCRQCSQFIKVYTGDGLIVEDLRYHLGHQLEEVTYVTLTEWLRVLNA